MLAAHGDQANAMFARLVGIRRLVLLSRLDAAEDSLAGLSLAQVPERLIAVAQLVAADIATRRLRTLDARAALQRAQKAAQQAGIPLLTAEVERALLEFEAPAARLCEREQEKLVNLEQVQGVLDSGELVVDGCRREVRAGSVTVSFVRRPVLFALLLALAEQAPQEVTRATLMWRAFATRRANDSHRARLRVEVGRVRKALGKLAVLKATANGFALVPPRGRHALLLLPPAPGDVSELLALLGSGDSWSTSALSLALGKSQRSVQRALSALGEAGKVSGAGRGRARRWVATPSTGSATTLLLVARGTLG